MGVCGLGLVIFRLFGLVCLVCSVCLLGYTTRHCFSYGLHNRELICMECSFLCVRHFLNYGLCIIAVVI